MPTLAALKHARGSLNLRNLQRDFYLASVMSAVAYFAIVGALDNPLYETDFGMGAKVAIYLSVHTNTSLASIKISHP